MTWIEIFIRNSSPFSPLLAKYSILATVILYYTTIVTSDFVRAIVKKWHSFYKFNQYLNLISRRSVHIIVRNNITDKYKKIETKGMPNFNVMYIYLWYFSMPSVTGIISTLKFEIIDSFIANTELSKKSKLTVERGWIIHWSFSL